MRLHPIFIPEYLFYVASEQPRRADGAPWDFDRAPPNSLLLLMLSTYSDPPPLSLRTGFRYAWVLYSYGTLWARFQRVPFAGCSVIAWGDSPHFPSLLLSQGTSSTFIHGLVPIHANWAQVAYFTIAWRLFVPRIDCRLPAGHLMTRTRIPSFHHPSLHNKTHTIHTVVSPPNPRTYIAPAGLYFVINRT
jgi:hypothetical protein